VAVAVVERRRVDVTVECHKLSDWQLKTVLSLNVHNVELVAHLPSIKRDGVLILCLATSNPLLSTREVREWLATCPFPAIPISSFPFPIPFP